jgi:ABC-2 type transport system ATP-binding protein
MNTATIDTRGLHKTFENGVQAVKDLSLKVHQGDVFGFLGPNGAGKTTTVRLLNGMLSPTRGESYVLGIPSGDEQVRRRTSTLAELAQMYENMSVYQNLLFYSRMYDLPASEAESRINQLLQRMDLWEKRDLKLGSFSTGMRKKAALARTLLHSPELLFLDEPTGGLDPEASRQVVGLISRLAREDGMTVFLCTHNLPLAESVCSCFGFLSHGRLIRMGTKEELIDSVWKQREIRIRTTGKLHRFPIQKDEEINRLVRRVMDQGEKIVEVVSNRPSLEDIYFDTVGGGENELE